MMLRWSLFALTLPLAALSLLAVAKSPDWLPWRLAVGVGEYGHWLALLPLLVGAVAWFARGRAVAVPLATGLLCALAFGLFTHPCLEAWKLGGALPGQLTRQLGPVAIDRAPFSFLGIFGRQPEPVSVETHAFSGELQLDFYRAAGRAPAPCIVLVHGGGWDEGSRDEIPHFNHWLARQGYAVAAIDYRLAPKFPWPAQRDDTLAALAFLKSRASALGIDATRFVLLGRSAGGNIAEAVGYTAHDPAIRAVIGLYAPADMHFGWRYARADDVLKSPTLMKQYLGGTPETAGPAYDSASSYLQVTTTTPPTLLMHGQLDTLVWHRQSERLAAKLAENHVPHAFVSLPWATHAFEYNLHGPGGQLTRYTLEWFLATVTR